MIYGSNAKKLVENWSIWKKKKSKELELVNRFLQTIKFYVQF